jgi:acyl-coenzyme A thioesterase PaaI-like protein
MIRRPPEPVEIVKSRREAGLARLVAGVPYIGFLGARFDRRGDELTAILPFHPSLIGNPSIPALHGGATAAFLEVTAIIELAWTTLWEDMEEGRIDPASETFPALPKTITFTVDYLRAGLPRDAYARATVTRRGRRYATVQVAAWQDNRARPFAQATAHFLMPEP